MWSERHPPAPAASASPLGSLARPPPCSSQQPEQSLQPGSRSCCSLTQTSDGSLLRPQSLALASPACVSHLILCISPLGHSCSHLGCPVAPAHQTSFCFGDFVPLILLGGTLLPEFYMASSFLPFLLQEVSLSSIPASTPVISSGRSSVTHPQARFLISLCFTLFLISLCFIGLLFKSQPITFYNVSLTIRTLPTLFTVLSLAPRTVFSAQQML